MEIVNIEARTFEAMLSAFRTFADLAGHPLLKLYGDMEEKKWLDNQEVCLLLKVSPRTLQTLRDNGTLAYTQICHKTYYKPGDVESIIRIVEERRKRAESMGKSI
ncbi:helix-turn-helix domain-containing protein [Phocaeicola dorei]|nr:helix-turn-helix domain-containing protein [Phocaeicola dorei]